MLKISQPQIDKKTQDLVINILKSGDLIEGKVAQKLEDSLKKLHISKYAVVFNSGTAALHSAIESLRLKPGSEIITSPLTFIATANTILMANLMPVFVDIDENTYNIDPNLIEKKISKKTKAILAVDLYGQPSEYIQLKNIAKKYGLYLIGDSCQAIGATYRSQPISNFTDVTVFSFYATKNITTGEGGAIVTNNKEIAMFCKSFKNHGRGKTPDDFIHLGLNYRLPDFAAALGLNQLKKINPITKARQKNAKYLTVLLKSVKGLITPYVSPNSSHTFHQYTIRLTKDFPKTRDQLLTILNENGVEAKIYYPKILTEYRHVLTKLSKKSHLKVAKKVSREILSLPIHPNISKKDLEQIASIIAKI